MKFIIEHKLDESQKDEVKAELDQALEDLKVRMEGMFDGWEKTKRVATYAIVASGVLGFVLGYIVGKTE